LNCRTKNWDKREELDGEPRWVEERYALPNGAVYTPKMTDLEQEVDQLFTNYFIDFGNLNLKAIVSYFHLPCTFIVPQDIFVFSSASEVEGFWDPRFDDLKAQRCGRTERAEGNVKVLNDNTALASSKAIRYTKDGAELERRGATFALRKTDDGWKIVTLIHHLPDNVVRMN